MVPYQKWSVVHCKDDVLLLPDELHDARANLTEMNRRLHELEIELRRLENEREELTAAYKEAEAVNILFVILSKYSLQNTHLRDD